MQYIFPQSIVFQRGEKTNDKIKRSVSCVSHKKGSLDWSLKTINS